MVSGAAGRPQLPPSPEGCTIKKKDEICAHPSNCWSLADDRKVKTIVEYLADELINATQGSSNCSTADPSSAPASNKEKPIQEKNGFHSKINPTYSKINPEVPNRRLKVLERQARKSFNDYKITRHSEANKSGA